jgi:hypothetical protein
MIGLNQHAISLLDVLRDVTQGTDAMTADIAKERWQSVINAFNLPESRNLPVSVIDRFVTLMTHHQLRDVSLSDLDRLDRLHEAIRAVESRETTPSEINPSEINPSEINRTEIKKTATEQSLLQIEIG